MFSVFAQFIFYSSLERVSYYYFGGIFHFHENKYQKPDSLKNSKRLNSNTRQISSRWCFHGKNYLIIVLKIETVGIVGWTWFDPRMSTNLPEQPQKQNILVKTKEDMNPGFDPGQPYHDPEALLAPHRRHRRAVSPRPKLFERPLDQCFLLFPGDWKWSGRWYWSTKILFKPNRKFNSQLQHGHGHFNLRSTNLYDFE